MSAFYRYRLAGQSGRLHRRRPAILRARVFEITAAAGQHVERGVPLGTLMGSDPDAMKLVSCLTLFRELDPEFARLADPILSTARK